MALFYFKLVAYIKVHIVSTMGFSVKQSENLNCMLLKAKYICFYLSLIGLNTFDAILGCCSIYLHIAFK